MNHNAQIILDAIIESDEHMTAEQIHMLLRDSGNNISLATVYNNQGKLCEQGNNRKVCVAGYPDRYDKVVKHDHLICRKCGKLSDISFSDLTGFLQSQTDEEILSYDLQVSYICPDCRKKEQKEQERKDVGK